MHICRYFDCRLSGQRHENTKHSRRINETLTREGTKISLLTFSCRRGEIFRVRALCLSCRSVFGRNNENTADLRVVMISPRNAKVEVTTITLFRVTGRNHDGSNRRIGYLYI
jgi:hypothetical protein